MAYVLRDGLLKIEGNPRKKPSVRSITAPLAEGSNSFSLITFLRAATAAAGAAAFATADLPQGAADQQHNNRNNDDVTKTHSASPQS